MKGAQARLCKVVKVIKSVQTFGEGSASKGKGEKKGERSSQPDEKPRPSLEAAFYKHVSWATKCITPGGGKAKSKADDADKALKSSKGKGKAALSSALSRSGRFLRSQSFSRKVAPATPAMQSQTRSETAPEGSPLEILMWIGDQYVDISKTLVPY